MRKALVFLIFVVFGACVARPTPIPDMSHKDAMLFSEKCGACHSVPHPKRHTYKQWEHMMVTMEKEGMSPLTAEEKAAILKYLKKYAR